MLVTDTFKIRGRYMVESSICILLVHVHVLVLLVLVHERFNCFNHVRVHVLVEHTTILCVTSTCTWTCLL